MGSCNFKENESFRVVIDGTLAQYFSLMERQCDLPTGKRCP